VFSHLKVKCKSVVVFKDVSLYLILSLFGVEPYIKPDMSILSEPEINQIELSEVVKIPQQRINHWEQS